ncbi:MAG: hypothetical protein ACKO1F_10875 [Flammeovirgaceae bacterium]
MILNHFSDDQLETSNSAELGNQVKEKNQERLRYVIEKDSETQGVFVVYWEKIEISLPFSIK